LEVRFDGFVLFVKESEVRDEVLDDIHVWKGVDLRVLARVPVDAAETGQGVLAINVHGTRTTDTLSARTPECEGRVNLVLDLDEGIEHHGSCLVEVDGVGLESGFLFWLIWIPAVDLELLEQGQFLCRHCLRRG